MVALPARELVAAVERHARRRDRRHPVVHGLLHARLVRALAALRADAAVDPALDASNPMRQGVVAAVVDPYVNGVHVSLLEPAELGESDQVLAERCLSLGPAGLSAGELSELLYCAPAMLMMHRAVWLRSIEGIHPKWSLAVDSYRRRMDAAYDPED